MLVRLWRLMQHGRCLLFGNLRPRSFRRPPPPLAMRPPMQPPTPQTPRPRSKPTQPCCAALELPRKEPADYFQAIGWLIDLGRPELAKPILDELAKLQMTDAQRAALVDAIRLATNAAVGPHGGVGPGRCRVCRCLHARRPLPSANDPRRIAQLVAQLTDPSPEVRSIARNDLSAAREGRRRRDVGSACARSRSRSPGCAWPPRPPKCDPLVDGPLLAMLSTNDPTLRAEVGSNVCGSLA